MKKVLLTATLAAFTFFSTHVAQAADMRVHGSGTVGKGIVLPNQAGIEQSTGFKLNVVTNGSGNGLKDLVAGKADVAMISAPLQVEADLTNAKAPGSLDISGLQEHNVGASKISFLIHPSNSGLQLTAAQIKDILTGKVTNWKAVGGADKAILLAVEKPGQGTRANVVAVFLGGAGFAGNARQFNALAQVSQVVGQAPNAFGYGNASSISDKVHVVKGVDVDQPLSIVTKGAPSADAQKLIDAVRAAAK